MESLSNEKQDIEVLAKQYTGLESETLSNLLLQEWMAAGVGRKTPVRGDTREFWQGVKKRLVAKVLENPNIIIASFSLAVAETVTWAKTIGLDLTAYRIPLAILSAAVAQSVLEELKKRQTG